MYQVWFGESIEHDERTNQESNHPPGAVQRFLPSFSKFQPPLGELDGFFKDSPTPLTASGAQGTLKCKSVESVPVTSCDY